MSPPPSGREPVRGVDQGGRKPVLADSAAFTVAAPAVCCPAAKSRSKAKKPGYNTFEGIEKWIMDTGSGVDI